MDTLSTAAMSLVPYIKIVMYFSFAGKALIPKRRQTSGQQTFAYAQLLQALLPDEKGVGMA